MYTMLTKEIIKGIATV